jgi:hypothetical protein
MPFNNGQNLKIGMERASRTKEKFFRDVCGQIVTL